MMNLFRSKDYIYKKEFESQWLSSMTDGEPSGIVMQLTPTEKFYNHDYEKKDEKRSFRFLLGYLRQYRKYFTQIILGLALGCVLQLLMPFLTQAIVDLAC